MTTEERERHKRVQALVTDELHRQIKAAAALRGMGIEDWLTEAAKEKLAKEGFGDTRVE